MTQHVLNQQIKIF